MAIGTPFEARWSKYSYPHFLHNKTKPALPGTVAKMTGFALNPKLIES